MYDLWHINKITCPLVFSELLLSLPTNAFTIKWNKILRPCLAHYDKLINAEIISAVKIHLALLKTWNRAYKFWVRPELQHDMFRPADDCITASAWRDIKL